MNIGIAMVMLINGMCFVTNGTCIFITLMVWYWMFGHFRFRPVLADIIILDDPSMSIACCIAAVTVKYVSNMLS